MARSHGILKTTVWDVGSEFRQLSRNAQWAYTMLISQPQITNCGCLPYLPHKWAALAAGGTRPELDQALAELEERRFIVVDETTSELLVRTFVKHDRIYRQPNLVKNARAEFRGIESTMIRDYLADRHPWLTDETIDPPEYEQNGLRETPSETPFTTLCETPSETPLETPSERSSETPSETPFPPAGTRVGATRTAPTPSPSPSPSRDGMGMGYAAAASPASGAAAATPGASTPADQPSPTRRTRAHPTPDPPARSSTTCPECGIAVMAPTTLADHLWNAHELEPEPEVGDARPEPTLEGDPA